MGACACSLRAASDRGPVENAIENPGVILCLRRRLSNSPMLPPPDGKTRAAERAASRAQRLLQKRLQLFQLIVVQHPVTFDVLGDVGCLKHPSVFQLFQEEVLGIETGHGNQSNTPVLAIKTKPAETPGCSLTGHESLSTGGCHEPLCPAQRGRSCGSARRSSEARQWGDRGRWPYRAGRGRRSTAAPGS